MTVQLKTCVLTGVKASGDQGRFEAMASTYDVDSVGDIVKPGAFSKTLEDWATKSAGGQHIPLLWSHRMDDPDYNLGHVVKAEERTGGLWVDCQLDLTSTKANQAYKLLKGGRVGNLSFAYDTEDQGPVTVNGKAANELRRLKLYEVSLTPIGANQHTSVLGVKTIVELLDGLDADTLTKADIVGLAKSLASTTTLIDQVLGRLPGTDHQQTGPATTPSQLSVMKMQAQLAAVGALV